MCLEGGSGLFVAVGGEVVEDDRRAGADFGDQHLPDIRRKGGPIHRAFDHPRRDQRITGQTRDQGLSAPTAERRIRFQAFAARGPAAQPGEVGLDRRFIQKDNTFRCPSYGWQAV